MQKAICDFLDIETNEIEVGFHINKKQNGEVFIVERLENGAGYCNYLSCYQKVSCIIFLQILKSTYLNVQVLATIVCVISIINNTMES